MFCCFVVLVFWFLVFCRQYRRKHGHQYRRKDSPREEPRSPKTKERRGSPIQRRTDAQTDGRADRPTEHTHGPTNKQMDQRTHGRTDGRTDGRADRRKDRRTNDEGTARSTVSRVRSGAITSMYSTTILYSKCTLSRWVLAHSPRFNKIKKREEGLRSVVPVRSVSQGVEDCGHLGPASIKWLKNTSQPRQKWFKNTNQPRQNG